MDIIDLYRADAWHWLVEADGRYWSSAARTYSNVAPEHFTRVQTEADLRETMARAGFADRAPGWAPAADDVRAEAQRRIIALTGASSLIETIVKQSNANMRANELNDIRLSGGTLTTAEQAEADALRGLANAIKAIRAASNVMEANPPADYADNSNWPA